MVNDRQLWMTDNDEWQTMGMIDNGELQTMENGRLWEMADNGEWHTMINFRQ